MAKYIKKKRRTLPVLPAILTAAALLTGLLSQRAYARTYVIRDGHRVMTYTTFATDPAKVLDGAGLALGAGDTYTAEKDAITVRRGQRVRVCYYGAELEVTTYGESVGGLLTRLRLPVATEDVLSHPMSADTFDGMVLRVDKIRSGRETYTAVMPYETAYCADPSAPEGRETVLVAGIDGQMQCTAQVTYVNGAEEKREVLSRMVVTAPVTEVVAVGTGPAEEKPSPPEGISIGDGLITLPTGEVLTYTGTATVRATAYTHTDEGCDFITATGTTVHRGTVAVDPRYIPYGTRMFIVSTDGTYVYGVAVAEDCGGDIKGDRMDLYHPTFEECIRFGRRTCTVYFLG